MTNTSIVLRRLLRLDAAVCIAGAAVLALASGVVARVAGLTSPWPAVATGAALVVYGEVQWAAARRSARSPGNVAVLVAGDAAFAAGPLAARSAVRAG